MRNARGLVRRIIEQEGWDLSSSFPGIDSPSLGSALLEPTRIYVRSLLPLAQEQRFKGLAHITGGGLLENIPRVLPAGCHATIDTDRWNFPPIFALLQQGGAIAPEEMARTFNCGIGMIAVVEPAQADEVCRALEGAGERVVEIGRIEEGQRGCTVRGSAGSWDAPKDWSATHNA